MVRGGYFVDWLCNAEVAGLLDPIDLVPIVLDDVVLQHIDEQTHIGLQSINTPDADTPRCS